MYKDYVPAKEAELVAYSTNFDTRITATPTAFGVTAAQATDYNTLHTAFVTAYNTATNPGTRTTANIIAKDTAKRPLIAMLRMLARIIQAYPETTDSDRELLGLTVPDYELTPWAPPALAPMIQIVSVTGHDMKIRLIDSANPTRFGKPAGVVGATVFSYVGEAAPTNIQDWKWEGNVTRTRFGITFGASVAAGAKVHLTAFWRNARDISGPACAPVATNLGGGLAASA